jgi:hypothetical protein
LTVKSSRQLVIDANVASAAGDKGTGDSKACRDFLEEVRKVCHRMVMTAAIRDEWNRHQSPFATRWRVSMQSKKKILFPEVGSHETLRYLIESSERLQNEGERSQLRKDCHLVEAALATEFRIVSLDVHARRLFSMLHHEFEDLGHIVWTNPGRGEEQPIIWLRQGARNDPFRCLGYRED